MRNATERSSGAIVLDASVFVRAVLLDHEGARRWIDTAATGARSYEPDLLWVEFANAMKQAVAAGEMREDDARDAVAAVLAFPTNARPLKHLVVAAFEVGLRVGLTVYDACYLVLAEAADATLVTFGRDFEGLYEPLELLA